MLHCVLHPFLCDIDDYIGRSFEHRGHWVEGLIAQAGA